MPSVKVDPEAIDSIVKEEMENILSSSIAFGFTRKEVKAFLRVLRFYSTFEEHKTYKKGQVYQWLKKEYCL